jgi:hypothetical protein
MRVVFAVKNYISQNPFACSSMVAAYKVMKIVVDAITDNRETLEDDSESEYR